MVDNVSLTPGTGVTIASDDVGGIQYQRVKNAFGADGVAVDVSSTSPFPVYGPDQTASGTITATDTVVGVHGGQGVPLTGTPTAGSYVLYPLTGAESGFTLRLSGTFGGGTVWIESSPDSTNGLDGGWVTNLMRQSGINNTFIDADITAAGIFRGVVAGYSYVRVRITGATTPSVTVAMRASRSPSVTALTAPIPAGTNSIGSLSRIAGSTIGTASGNQFQARVAATAVTTGTLLVAAPASGLSLYVTDFAVSNSGTVTTVVSLLPAAGTAIWDSVAAPAGGGSSEHFTLPIKFTAATALHYAMTVASTTVYINVAGYIAP